MKPRKIIFECHVGSKLYGTNRPDSDDDFMGVFLPSTEDLFSMQNCPTEWSCNEKVTDGHRNTVGDIDRKYYSVQKYLNLLAAGQPKQLEMLFAPKDKILIQTKEWDLIKNNETMFIAKNSILPFVGFAKAQAYKATLKGDNLNLVRRLIDGLERYKSLGINLTVKECIMNDNTVPPGTVNFLGFKVKTEQTEYRPGVLMDCVVIAGRKFEYTQSHKNVLTKLKELEAKYGTRSEEAANTGYDYKSLMHSYRLLFETYELLRTKRLKFPMDQDKRDLLLRLRNGEYEADYFQEIEDKLIEIKNIKSDLPEEVNWSKVNKLCTEILMEYHLGKT